MMELTWRVEVAKGIRSLILIREDAADVMSSILPAKGAQVTSRDVWDAIQAQVVSDTT